MLRYYRSALHAGVAIIGAGGLTSLAQAQTSTAQTSTAQTADAPTTLVVTAPKPLVSNRIDRKVYRVDQDLQSTTGSASDVLGNLPSFDVDIDGAVSLCGDTSVTILIDGKPSPQMSGSLRGASLQQFPADQIEWIEVITNPSAQFKPDGTSGCPSSKILGQSSSQNSGGFDLGMG